MARPFDVLDYQDEDILRELQFASDEESVNSFSDSEFEPDVEEDLSDADWAGSPQPGSSGLAVLQPVAVTPSGRSSSSEEGYPDADEEEGLVDGGKAEARSAETWAPHGDRRDPFAFESPTGPRGRILDAVEPIDFFECFIDDELAEFIAFHTNVYADQQIQIKKRSGKMKRRSRDQYWKPTTADEIKLLIGLLFLQGVVQKPTNEMFFSRKRIVETPIFHETITEQRFFLLLKFLHFNNNEEFNPKLHNGKLYKILPIIEYLLVKFQELYCLDRNVCVDESLLLWKGRLSWKMFLPKKRARFGMESYCLCESKTGYVWNIILYTGKCTELATEVRGLDISNCKKPTRIVLTLGEKLLGKGHTIVVDNYYGSPELFSVLCSFQTDGLGTTRSNVKGLPKEVTTKKLNKGEIVSAFKEKMMCLRWMDKKYVTVLSTTHSNNMTMVRNRRQQEIWKPEAVVDYNRGMGGVDLSDQYIATYSVARKRLKKFYQKIFRHMIDVAMFNSFVIYKQRGGKLTNLEYRLSVIQSIIEKYGRSCTKYTRLFQNTDRPGRLVGRHFPDYTHMTGKRRDQKRCMVCASHKLRKATTILCSTCNVSLCLAPCFKNYHTLQNY